MEAKKAELIESISHKSKILLVEDDKLAAHIYEEVLKNEGFEYTTVDSGEKAIEEINKTKYDLIICDVVLGKINGIEVLKHAKKINPSQELVLITAHSNIDDVLEGMKHGATDYIKKPISAPELVMTIHKIIEKKEILNQYEVYKKYHELLYVSQQITMSYDVPSLIQTCMDKISQFFKAKHAMFVEIKKDATPTYYLLGRYHIAQDKASKIVEDFIDKNQIEGYEHPPIVKEDLVCIPIFEHGFIAYMFLIQPDFEPYNQKTDFENHLETDLRFLQKQISLALKNVIKLYDAKKLAITDDLTGLRNQRFLEICLEQELQNAKKKKKPLSVLFIDVDRFKQVNESYGHLVGSKILRELAEVMRQSVKVKDREKIIRYGGDEYVIILSNISSEEAKLIADRLREKVEKYIFLKTNGDINITISIGIASYPETSFTKDGILTLADKALFEAKKKSRNTVYMAADIINEKN